MIGANASSCKGLAVEYSNVLKKVKFYLILLLFLLFFSPITDTVGTITQEDKNAIDGVISDGEYDFNITVGDGDYSLYWQVIEDEIYFAIRGETTGWVAIGIDPEDRMENADMIFGWVNSTGVYVVDAFATGPYGPHPPDTVLEGSDNILEFNGSEESDVTIIEFKRLLNTNDDYDKPIPKNGTVTAIWAIGSSDSFTFQHSKRDYFEFSPTQIIIPSQEIADFFPPVILGSGLGLSLIGLLIFVDSFGRQRENKKEKLNIPRGENE
ncbi:MAG: DOMON domain-containing protein [Candidatus Hodarchaeales archaeon]|jgi:hypothetical protein